MGLNAKKVEGGNNGHKQETLDAGTYPARLVQVIDLGVQKQRPWQGNEKEPAQMIYTTYELLDEFIVDEEGNTLEDKPRWLSEDFPFHNLELDQAKSTKRYYAMDPKDEHDGDWEKLLGTPVMLTITNKEGKGKNAGKFYNNIAGVSKMRDKDAEKAVELKNPTKFFVVTDPDMDTFMALPKWLQDRIKENVEYDGSDLEDAIRNYKPKDDGEGKGAKENKDNADAEVSSEVDSSEDKDDGEW